MTTDQATEAPSASPTNLVFMDPDAFLPRWRWTDLESILTTAMPPQTHEKLALCLDALQQDAPAMAPRDILSDVLVAIRMAGMDLRERG